MLSSQIAEEIICLASKVKHDLDVALILLCCDPDSVATLHGSSGRRSLRRDPKRILLSLRGLSLVWTLSTIAATYR